MEAWPKDMAGRLAGKPPRENRGGFVYITMKSERPAPFLCLLSFRLY